MYNTPTNSGLVISSPVVVYTTSSLSYINTSNQSIILYTGNPHTGLSSAKRLLSLPVTENSYLPLISSKYHFHNCKCPGKRAGYCYFRRKTRRRCTIFPVAMSWKAIRSLLRQWYFWNRLLFRLVSMLWKASWSLLDLLNKGHQQNNYGSQKLHK